METPAVAAPAVEAGEPGAAATGAREFDPVSDRGWEGWHLQAGRRRERAADEALAFVTARARRQTLPAAM